MQQLEKIATTFCYMNPREREGAATREVVAEEWVLRRLLAQAGNYWRDCRRVESVERRGDVYH